MFFCTKSKTCGKIVGEPALIVSLNAALSTGNPPIHRWLDHDGTQGFSMRHHTSGKNNVISSAVSNF
jgi:hypothetical protein